MPKIRDKMGLIQALRTCRGSQTIYLMEDGTWTRESSAFECYTIGDQRIYPVAMYPEGYGPMTRREAMEMVREWEAELNK